MSDINVKPRQTLANLRQEFERGYRYHYGIIRTSDVSIGLEIEVPWRAYFPELWVEGFPNIPKDQLDEISRKCSIKEQLLLPLLNKTIECGVPRGADRYWEFAFDPVTDVSIVVNQIQILKNADLLPTGNHSLHITIGGMRVTRETYYLAFMMEMLMGSSERVLSAFNHKNPNMSAGWARKGFGGVFEKGGHELQHGCPVATEFRMMTLPDDSNVLLRYLTIIQKYSESLIKWQNGGCCELFVELMTTAQSLLAKHGLPDNNWKKPNMAPEVWTRFSEVFKDLRSDFHWSELEWI